MKIIVWNSQDKCVADYHKLIRGCDVLCLLDCGQWTVPVYALQIQNGLFHWKDEHEGLSYDILYRSSQRIPSAYHQLFIYHSCGLYGFLFVGRL